MKFYTTVREFNEEVEPKMGPQEKAVFDAISAGNPEDKDTTSRDAVVARLAEAVKAGEVTTTQEPTALLGFQQRSLQLRGLIAVETVNEGGKGATKKDTLTKKLMKRLREFDEANEPKMSPHEEMVYKHIPAGDGVLREDVIAAIQAEIDGGAFETVQKPGTIVSFNQSGLRKRGLISIESIEVARPADADGASDGEGGDTPAKKKGRGSKAAA